MAEGGGAVLQQRLRDLLPEAAPLPPPPHHRTPEHLELLRVCHRPRQSGERHAQRVCQWCAVKSVAGETARGGTSLVPP